MFHCSRCKDKNYVQGCGCGCGRIGTRIDRKNRVWTYFRGHYNGPKNYARGPRSPHWRGGIQRDKDGYILIYSPGHPHARIRGKKEVGYVAEHRLVMEKTLRRYLESWEDVHHMNHVKDDNRPENLMLISHNKHPSLHKKNGSRT